RSHRRRLAPRVLRDGPGRRFAARDVQLARHADRSLRERHDDRPAVLDPGASVPARELQSDLRRRQRAVVVRRSLNWLFAEALLFTTSPFVNTSPSTNNHSCKDSYAVLPSTRTSPCTIPNPYPNDQTRDPKRPTQTDSSGPAILRRIGRRVRPERNRRRRQVR